MLTQLAADVFGQAAPSNINDAPQQPAKLQEAVIRFADVVVDGAVAEALNLQGIVEAVRNDPQPEQLAKVVVKQFGDALAERNYVAAKQRKCDFNAVLKAAIAHADFEVAAAGLQANAKAARGHGKPAKSVGMCPISAAPEEKGRDALDAQGLAFISNLRNLGFKIEAVKVTNILKVAGILP